MSIIAQITKHWEQVEIGIETAPREHKSITEIKQPIRIEKPDMKSWQDSEPIKALSDHLHQCDGIFLVDLDGSPALHFAPPLTVKDFKTKGKRFKQAVKAIDLATKAKDDIKYLMAINGIRLQRAGPPQSE